MGHVWDRATEFLGDHFATLLPIVGAMILVPRWIQDALHPLTQTLDPRGAEALALNGLVLLLNLISIFGQLAVTSLALDPELRLGGAIARAGRTLGPFLIVMLTILLVVLVFAAPVYGVLWSAGPGTIDQVAARLSGPASWFVTIWVLLLCVAALWALARLPLMLQAVVVAERRAFGAIGRAFALSRGLVWPSLGAFLLLLFVWIVARLAAGWAARVVVALVDPAGSGGIGIDDVIVGLPTALVSTVFAVVLCAYGAKLYLAVVQARAQAVVLA